MAWPDYTYKGSACQKRADPVNLVFEDIDYSTVVSEIQTAAGALSKPEKWFNPTILKLRAQQASQWLCENGLPGGRQDDWLATGHFSRYHVRFWAWNGGTDTVGSAHYEYFTLRKGHIVSSYESGEVKIRELLDDTLQVFPDDVPLGNKETQPFCNGDATRITR